MSFGKIFDIFSSIFGSSSTPKVPDVIEPSPVTPSIVPSVTPVMALIPDRNPLSVTGSQFIQNNMDLHGQVREDNILKELANGNIPDFLRSFKPITVSNANGKITYYVMSDVICIGSEEDYVRIPMTPLTAQKIADAYRCILPTRKIADDIWKNAPIKLAPLPWGPPYDGTMSATYRYGEHSKRIQAQLVGKDYKDLISGHKKDVVLTNKLFPNNVNKRVAIYGWIQPNGIAIQGLNPTSHEDTYADYSHGIRYVSKNVLVNGIGKDISVVLKDPNLSSLLSDEGILNFVRY